MYDLFKSQKEKYEDQVTQKIWKYVKNMDFLKRENRITEKGIEVNMSSYFYTFKYTEHHYSKTYTYESEGVVVIAHNHKEIYGLGGLEFNKEDNYTRLQIRNKVLPKIGWFYFDLMVREKHRYKGIGTELLKDIIRYYLDIFDPKSEGLIIVYIDQSEEFYRQALNKLKKSLGSFEYIFNNEYILVLGTT